MIRFIGLLALLGALLVWASRAYNAAKDVRDIHRDTKGLRRRVRGGIARMIGTPLARVTDPRLAAVVLMIQLVRTGSPVTAAEKTKILEFMAEPLRVADVAGVFEQAWAYTTPRTFFSSVSDELLPMLRERLDIAARGELVAMLGAVANAYSGASDLQLEAIARLKTRLLRA